MAMDISLFGVLWPLMTLAIAIFALRIYVYRLHNLANLSIRPGYVYVVRKLFYLRKEVQ